MQEEAASGICEKIAQLQKKENILKCLLSSACTGIFMESQLHTIHEKLLTCSFLKHSLLGDIVATRADIWTDS